jgi:hypothetical protein
MYTPERTEPRAVGTAKCSMWVGPNEYQALGLGT